MVPEYFWRDDQKQQAAASQAHKCNQDEKEKKSFLLIARPDHNARQSKTRQCQHCTDDKSTEGPFQGTHPASFVSAQFTAESILSPQ
jgi:hypothetical protein